MKPMLDARIAESMTNRRPCGGQKVRATAGAVSMVESDDPRADIAEVYVGAIVATSPAIQAFFGLAA
ncbi:hypothetical protein [Pseudaminobacter soli (ex Li et al. 2025)]|uniref:hypothetical protein n=1 Tax=Pseudaminobacter soli (ex Li et al. 2025) TaxID=1295366 RepID=UPI00247398B1|nr:hypothetical protein [Mesorhizobium soli]